MGSLKRPRGRLLMFDLDGTLFDTRRDLAAAVNAMRRNYHLPALPLDTVTGYIGDGLAMLVGRSLRGHRADRAEAIRLCAQHYRRHLHDATRPYPGVRAGLRRLHRAGYRLALISNKPAAACRSILRHHGLGPLFAHISGGDSTRRLKPHPEPLTATLEALRIRPDEAWMIGDHTTDLEAARRAGVRRAWVTYGFGKRGRHRPRFVFHSFDELTAFFLRRGRANPPLAHRGRAL